MIRKLRLSNCFCFRGEHELELEAKVYAITAEYEDQEGRSNWGGKCLPGDTIVYHPNLGPITIQEFVHNRYTTVLGFNNNEIKSVPVIGWIKSGLKPITKIVTADGVADRYGADHPILTQRGFIRAADIQQGDFIAKAGLVPIMTSNSELTADDGTMVGLILGDGVFCSGVFKFCALDEDKLRVFNDAASRLFPNNDVHYWKGASTIVRKKENHGVSNFGSTAVRSWISKVGLIPNKSEFKKIPVQFLIAPDPVAISVIRALMLTDGYVSPTKEVSYSSASYEIVSGLRFLFLRFGIQTRIYQKPVKGKLYFVLALLADSLIKFLEIGGIEGRKGKRLVSIIEASKSKYRKPNVDVIPFAVWSKYKLNSAYRKPNGKLRSITSWRQSMRGMSRSVFMSFGGPPEIANGSIRWELVADTSREFEEQTYDISIDTNEHIYVTGVQFSLTHNSSIMKLLGPMPFFGWHGLDKEDDWITKGEENAYYEIELDSGVRIKRSRATGKSTQIELFDHGRKAGQKGAQAEIQALIGLSEDDFFASCYFKQKNIDRLIQLRPAERQELVMGWLDLVPLKKCEESDRAELNEISKEITELETKLATDGAIKERIETELSGFDLDSLKEQLNLASERATDYGRAATKLATLQMAHSHREAEIETLAELEAQAAELVTRVTSKDYRKEILDAQAKVSRTRDECKVLKVLAVGEFDGACPVSRGFQCPAKADLNAMASQHVVALKAAQERQREATMAYNDLVSDSSAYDELISIRSRIKNLNKTIAVPLEDLPKDNPSELAQKYNIEVGQLQIRIIAITKSKIDLGLIMKSFDKLNMRLAELIDRRTRISESIQVFKMAQTKCAESGISEIESGANDLLSESGLDLSVSLKWQREGGGLAKFCDSCGETFPASTKIRNCTKCHADRGKNYVEKLLVDLSDRSGGAEDLAGLSLQLSAAAWLRNKRATTFDIVYLDEIAGALDSANRQAVAMHISNMITGKFGFNQGFIVSHSPEVDAVFPGRIEILVKKDGSRIISVV